MGSPCRNIQTRKQLKNVDAVHTGECWAAGRSGRCRPVSRQQALDALGHQFPACVHCRPGTALGILD
ncbi:DUF6233 domain-containing protein [Streptomyces massasporeus]|uniref:DUF6233 domain-containing protein n=1 Tax=Streptomyces massasporeus TaxID=67324 RepID=UPI0034525943